MDRYFGCSKADAKRDAEILEQARDVTDTATAGKCSSVAVTTCDYYISDNFYQRWLNQSSPNQ